MEIVIWLIAFLSAFLTGWFLVRYLTVHPLKMSINLSLTIIFGITCLTLSILLYTLFQTRYIFIAIPVFLISFITGYWLQTRIFLNTADTRTSPELTRQVGDLGKGHTAVIYLTHGEPETYDPIGWINQFREFDRQGIPFVPRLVRPLFAYKLRNGYLHIGRSNHLFMHKQMIKALEREYRNEGDSTTRFYLSFLDASPTARAAAIQALNDGASRIITVEVFLTVSNHTAQGEDQIRSLEIDKKFGVPVNFTGPLYDSETLKCMFLTRANAVCENIDKAKVGILLIGHGQPDQWDKQWPTETEHELSFRNGILEALASSGYKKDNLSLAWMEFKEPRLEIKLKEFVNKGVEWLLYFSAAISADSMHSQYEAPRRISKVKISPNIQLFNMGAWNDDPMVIQAIKEKIDLILKS